MVDSKIYGFTLPSKMIYVDDGVYYPLRRRCWFLIDAHLWFWRTASFQNVINQWIVANQTFCCNKTVETP